MSEIEIKEFGQRYLANLSSAFDDANCWGAIDGLFEDLKRCYRDGKQVFVCGNGGSGGNAIHIANDLIYGITKKLGKGLRIHALTANSSVLTCLANDEGYEQIFAHQLGVYANQGDVLITLSGSGNSPNILEVIKAAKPLGVTSYAILGFDGGAAKDLADSPLHFPINDMQISEDIQLIIFHMAMQRMYDWLKHEAS